LNSTFHQVLLLLLSGGLPEYFLLLLHLLLAALEEIAEIRVGKQVVGLLLRVEVAPPLLLLRTMKLSELVALGVLAGHQWLSLSIADGLVNLSLYIMVFDLLAATAGALPVDKLRLDDLFYTFFLLRFVVALAAIELGDLRGRYPLLPTFRCAFLITFI
jgi:hypothetical protein